MSVILWLLAVCALIVMLPMAAATLLLTVSLIVTAVSDLRGKGRMRRQLDELIRERRS